MIFRKPNLNNPELDTIKNGKTWFQAILIKVYHKNVQRAAEFSIIKRQYLKRPSMANRRKSSYHECSIWIPEWAVVNFNEKSSLGIFNFQGMHWNSQVVEFQPGSPERNLLIVETYKNTISIMKTNLVKWGIFINCILQVFMSL